MTTRQFVSRYLIASLALLALVGLFNRIVDPAWYYRDVEIRGFNLFKPAFRNYERDIKPALLVRQQPEAIVLGSSFAEIGIDPRQADFTDAGHLKGMNHALAGAPWNMVYCNFEFALTHAKVKRVLIGFHPNHMPPVDCAKDFARLGKVNTAELLFSMSALRASIDTIKKQKTERPSHTPDGQFFFRRDEPSVHIRFGEDFARYKRQKPKCSAASPAPFDAPGAAPLDLGGLRRMIRLAADHNVELTLFAYPQHAFVLELDHRCGEQDHQWRAMQQIAAVIEAEAQPGRVRAWQFYSYNAITAEPVGSTTKYWQDSLHFNFEVGDRMLADMFGKDPAGPGFGRPIRTETIKADFQYFLQGRSDYLKDHPEFQADLKKLEEICSNPANRCRSEPFRF